MNYICRILFILNAYQLKLGTTLQIKTHVLFMIFLTCGLKTNINIFFIEIKLVIFNHIYLFCCRDAI